MRWIFSFLVSSAVLSAVASAQGVDESDVVVSLSAKVYWGDSAVPPTATATMACYALSGTLGMSGCESQKVRGSSLPDTTDLDRLNTRLIPGVRYTVLMKADNQFDPSATYNGIPGFDLAVSAPSGYVVELEQVAGCEGYFVSLSRNAQNPLTLVRLRVLAAGVDPGLAAGMATPLSTDKKLWQISLGDAPNGGRAGTLSFNALASSASLAAMFTRQNFSFDSVASASVLIARDLADNQSIRQVIAPQVCIDVIGSSLTSGNIELRCYHASQRPGTTDSNGYFIFSGSPFATYLIQPQGSDTAGVIITGTFRDLGDSSTRTLTTKLTRTGTAPAFTWTADGWHTGTSVVSQTIRARNGMSETLTVQSGSAVALSSTRTYTSFGLTPLGDEITQESNGSSNPMTTNYSFYADEGQISYGRPEFIWNNGGAWTGFVYNNDGRPASQYSPFANTDVKPVSLPAGSGTVTTYTYSADPWGRNTRIAEVETKTNGSTTTKSVTSYANETPFSSYTAHPTLIVLRSTRTDYSASGSSLTTITKQFYEAAEDFFRGQVHSIERPDKVKQSFAYQQGSWNGATFTPSANVGLDAPAISATNATRIAAFTGSSDSSAGTALSSFDGYPVDTLYLVSGKSTREITIRDANANIVRTETHVWSAGAWSLISWVNYTYNLANQLTNRTASNGSIWSATYSGERKTGETDASGIELTYGYDGADRIDTVTRAAAGTTIAALTTKFTYDAADRMTQQTMGYGLSETVTSSKDYDDAGRVVSQSDAGPKVVHASRPTSSTEARSLSPAPAPSLNTSPTRSSPAGWAIPV